MATEPCSEELDPIVIEHEPSYQEQILSKLDEIIGLLTLPENPDNPPAA